MTQPNQLNQVASGHQNIEKLNTFADSLFLYLGVPDLQHRISWSWATITHKGRNLEEISGLLSDAFEVGSFKVTVGMRADLSPSKWEDDSIVVVSATNKDTENPIRGVVLTARRNNDAANKNPREVSIKYVSSTFDGKITIKSTENNSQQYMLTVKSAYSEAMEDPTIKKIVDLIGAGPLSEMLLYLQEAQKNHNNIITAVCSLLAESEINTDEEL